VSVGIVSAPPAEAVSGSEFNPAFIVSDANFFDSNAMTQPQIQSFLDSKVGQCANGNCLKIVRTNSTSQAADRICKTYSGAASELASSIIFKVQQACGISAKALLVTLQKEQGLVTNSGPSASILDRAMGFACPDNTAVPGWCDPAYGGLFNQIYRAAWQLKYYSDPDVGTSFTYFPVGRPSAIKFNPSVSCGSSQVTIVNKATASLYYYTPYQPNAAALRNLGGTGDGCSAYGNRNFWVYFNNWFGSPTGVSLAPIGNFELGSATIEQSTLRGWAFDPETAAPIDIHLYLDGDSQTGRWGGSFRADVPRRDIADAYPSYGANHGFEVHFPVAPGSFQACMYAINVGQGTNLDLGCRTISTPTGSPFGNLESASLAPDRSLTLTGWTVDPDTPNPTSVHVYVNGAWGGAYAADSSRADVALAYAGYGSAHGFRVSMRLPVGTSNVCVYTINVGVGDNKLISCATVSTASGPPIGNIDSVATSVGAASISGWAIDPDTPDAVAIHAYVDGRWGGAFLATATRNDVAGAYPGYGASHGFVVPLQMNGGAHEVCLYAINVGTGYNESVGCRTVRVPGGSPIGNIDSVTIANGLMTISGWALDPDTSRGISVHAYISGQWAGAYSAVAPRSDVGNAYPGYGPEHGYQFSIGVPTTAAQLCLYGINVGVGYNEEIGCRTVTNEVK
jgi:hypothetical protein